MPWTAIPDADIDANSALKTTDVIRLLRDNFEFVAAGDVSVAIADRIGLESAYLSNQPAGYIRGDGSSDQRCIVAPVEINAIYVFDETVTGWVIPFGVRQFIVEVWGAGSYGNTYPGGKCGAYALKLLDFSAPTIDIVVGEGGGRVGGDSSVKYDGLTIIASGGNYDAVTDATNGDINISGGDCCPVRGGGSNIETNAGAFGAGGEFWGQVPGGNGRVTIRILG